MYDREGASTWARMYMQVTRDHESASIWSRMYTQVTHDHNGASSWSRMYTQVRVTLTRHGCFTCSCVTSWKHRCGPVVVVRDLVSFLYTHAMCGLARLPEPFLGQLHVREVLYTTRNSITSGFLQSAATNSFHRRAMQLGWLTASPCQTQ